MRRLSYFLGFLTVALFLLTAASVTRADGLDPKVGLGPTGSNPCSGPDNQACTQNNCFDELCTLQLDSTGSGIADILNDTGFMIISDTINIGSAFLPPLTCDPKNSFGFNDVFGGGDSPTCTYAFNPDLGDPPGIGAGSYGIIFTDFTDANGTPLRSLIFDLVSSPGDPITPEPGTLLLLGTGCTTLVASRKKLKGAKQA
jgi:hypothetical protein